MGGGLFPAGHGPSRLADACEWRAKARMTLPSVEPAGTHRAEGRLVADLCLVAGGGGHLLDRLTLAWPVEVEIVAHGKAAVEAHAEDRLLALTEVLCHDVGPFGI